MQLSLNSVSTYNYWSEIIQCWFIQNISTVRLIRKKKWVQDKVNQIMKFDGRKPPRYKKISGTADHDTKTYRWQLCGGKARCGNEWQWGELQGSLYQLWWSLRDKRKRNIASLQKINALKTNSPAEPNTIEQLHIKNI